MNLNDARDSVPANPANTGAPAKKNPNRLRLGFECWWSRRELNPRPQALCRQFYMLIRFILSFNLGSCQPTGPSLAIHINLRAG